MVAALMASPAAAQTQKQAPAPKDGSAVQRTSPSEEKSAAAPVTVVAAPPSVSPAPILPLPKVTPTPASEPLALALATTLSPESLTRRILERAYTVTLPGLLQKNTQFVALESAYPGVIKVVLAAERSVTEPHALAALPALRKAMTRVFVDYLTPDELGELKQFYEGPVGQKAIAAAGDGVDLTAIARRNLNGDETPLQASDIRQAGRNAGAKLVDGLSEEELPQLAAFGLSPVGRKWRRLQPMLAQARAAADNASASEIKTKAEDAVAQAVQAFIKEADAKKKAP